MSTMLKLIDLINLQTYDREIKEYIAERLSQSSSHTHDNKEILDKITADLYDKLANLVIDSELLADSTNPVQNKIVKQALDDLRSYIDEKVSGGGVEIEPRNFSISGAVTAEPVVYDGTKDVVLQATKVNAMALYLDTGDTLILNGDF